MASRYFFYWKSFSRRSERRLSYALSQLVSIDMINWCGQLLKMPRGRNPQIMRWFHSKVRSEARNSTTSHHHLFIILLKKFYKFLLYKIAHTYYLAKSTSSISKHASRNNSSKDLIWWQLGKPNCLYEVKVNQNMLQGRILVKLREIGKPKVSYYHKSE